jgi:integrase
VWEVRIPATDPITGRHRQLSVTVHGSSCDADARRIDLLARYPASSGIPAAGALTVADLLGVWVDAPHPWKPSTLIGYRCVVRALRADPIGRARADALTPAQVRAAIGAWQTVGASVATIGGRFRVLRSALSWGYDERLLERHPLRLMRGPGRPAPRRPLSDHDVRALIATAELHLLEILANHHAPDRVARSDGGVGGSNQRHPSRRRVDPLQGAEQDLLMVRLAADTGARRGELAALHIADLTGRVLHINRSISAGRVATPKSDHDRTLTVGESTAQLWHQLVDGWKTRASEPVSPWLFASDPVHEHRLGTEMIGGRFSRLREHAGVPGATLHRLQHSVATFLVARGQILQAQARLGHADAATTLREYAHALPLTDASVADAIEEHLTPDEEQSTIDEPTN